MLFMGVYPRVVSRSFEMSVEVDRTRVIERQSGGTFTTET
jgi:hypothetical protein